MRLLFGRTLGIVCIVIATLWLLAGVAKTLAWTDLTSTIHTLFPSSQPEFDQVVAAIIIFLDFALGIGFLIPRTRLPAAAIQCVVCMMFAGLHILRLTDGLAPSCSCFGHAFKPTPLFAISLNTLLIAASVALMLQKDNRYVPLS